MTVYFDTAEQMSEMKAIAKLMGSQTFQKAAISILVAHNTAFREAEKSGQLIHSGYGGYGISYSDYSQKTAD